MSIVNLSYTGVSVRIDDIGSWTLKENVRLSTDPKVRRCDVSLRSVVLDAHHDRHVNHNGILLLSGHAPFLPLVKASDSADSICPVTTGFCKGQVRNPHSLSSC